jgi:hypothetical protein
MHYRFAAIRLSCAPMLSLVFRATLALSVIDAAPRSDASS